ncbi:Organic cation transporter protein [Holothuria leucospilota]|uniref:Organic cation transporter protein n=1 Tax=Holothuria leucospilota TaxID=206669 RepID=A0A9Q0YR00_HOLLE|nr:Organic cation transporter protein [Holothuria leucospilota]
MVNFDDVLEATGGFGWYQARTYLFLCIPALLGSLLTFTQVFIGGVGDHWCKVSQWENDGCSQWGLTSLQCNALKKNLTVPEGDYDEKCMMYNLTGVDLETVYGNYAEVAQLDVIKCNDGWVFDKSVYQSTITEDWELVCDKSAVPNVLQSVYLAGFLLGCLLFGYLADKIGRYYTFFMCNGAAAIFTVLSAFSPNAVVYGILRFLIGASSYGSTLTAFVFATEMVLPGQRVYVGVVLWYWFACGYFVLSALGRYLASWRVFIALTVVPFVFLIPSVLVLTESPRWLLSKKRYQEAEEISKKIAKVNKKEVSSDFLAKLREDNLQPTEKATLLDIFRSPVIFLYLLNLLYNWFVQSFVYYGLSLGTSSLGVNVFIAFCISGAVELPAYTFSIYTMKWLGRKISTGSLMILAGVACFATIPAPDGPLRVCVAMIGKFAITASFSNIYVHTAEIFPTPLRTLSVGTCSVAARIGGIIAPLILFLENYWKQLPLACFAASSVLAGALVFLLPETKGKPMPDTIEDTINLRNLTVKVDDDKNFKPLPTLTA